MAIKNICIVLAGTAMLSACIPSINQKPITLTPEEQAQYASISPQQLQETAERQLQEAHAAELNMYAPIALEQMENQLKELRDLSKKPDADKIKMISLSKSVEQNLQSGIANKALALSQLSDVFAQKKVLEEIGVTTAYPGDYKDAVDDILDLVKYIEAGKADKARSKTPAALEDMHKLEIRFIKENTLTKAKNVLEKAEDKDADEIAEKSFIEATQAYDRAAKYIDNNPRDTKEVSHLGNEALFYANRAVWIADEVTKLKAIKPKELETVALDSELRLHRISEAMKSPDVRDLNLHEQSVALASLAENLLKASEHSQEKSTQLEQSKAELTAADERIKALENKITTIESENSELKQKIQAAIAHAKTEPTITTQEQSAAETTE